MEVGTIQAVQAEQGAVWEAEMVPLTYGHPERSLMAARQGVALCDRSHWSRLRLGDRDCRRFLHNQTTNHIEQLAPGQCCPTVFVTSTGRTLELATVVAEVETLGLWVSPGQGTRLLEWMDRFIFFADRVTLADETATTAAVTLLGPDSGPTLQQWGLETLPAPGHHAPFAQGAVSGQILAETDLGLPGYTLTVPTAQGAALWQALTAAGAVPLGEAEWEILRVEQGRPAPGRELTEEFNPLEAGLWGAVSFNKGCYIGQETIARLNTYQGVKQQLWGIHLAGPVAPDSPILYEGAKAGRVTSVVTTPEGVRGLGYVRTKVGGAGLAVTVEGVPGQIVEIPLASRGYLAVGA